VGIRKSLAVVTSATSIIAACVFGGPDVRFVDTSTTEFTDSTGNYSLEVRCTARNEGDPGPVTVSASVDGLGGAWTESETFEIQADEHRVVVFTFPEVERQPPGLGDYRYSCAAEAP
jgi:hypothetical protein